MNLLRIILCGSGTKATHNLVYYFFEYVVARLLIVFISPNFCEYN